MNLDALVYKGKGRRRWDRVSDELRCAFFFLFLIRYKIEMTLKKRNASRNIETINRDEIVNAQDGVPNRIRVYSERRIVNKSREFLVTIWVYSSLRMEVICA